MKKYEKTGYLHHDFKIFHLTDHEMSAYDFHYHDFHKLLFFLSGNVTYCIEGKSYQLTPGDLVLVRAGEVHRPVIHDTTPYERMIIYVSPDFLKPVLSSGRCHAVQCAAFIRHEGTAALRYHDGTCPLFFRRQLCQ